MPSVVHVVVLVCLLAVPAAAAQPVPPVPPAPIPRKEVPVVKPLGPAHPRKAPPPAPAAAARAPAPAPAPVPAPAQPADKQPDAAKPDAEAAKLPRFASLRADEVNMRAGPGLKYPIEWVYKRRDLPVEIEREFDVWRYVRDADGIRGWVQQATLTGRRSFVVGAADATLREEASDASAAVAVLMPGVVGRIRSCEKGSDWCNVSAGSYRGFLRRGQFWGTLPNEAVAP